MYTLEKVTEMGDTHLLNLALAGFGISAAAAIVLALAIIGIAALTLRNKAATGTESARLATVPAAGSTQPAAPGQARRAA